MTNRRIWIGDALRALQCANSEQDRAHVLRVLGLGPAERADDSTTAPDSPQETASPPETTMPESNEHVEDPTALPSPAPDMSSLQVLNPIGYRTLTDASPPPGVLARYTSGRTRRLPHQPLLEPRSSSAFLRSLIAHRAAEGEIDLKAAIESLAVGHPFLAMPRLAALTLRSGAQVLIDQGPGMQPYRRDQADVVRRIREILGHSLLQVGLFSGTPMSGIVPDRGAPPVPYLPPPSRTRVLVLTDLGLGLAPYPGYQDDWLRFAAVAARADCPVAVLTPYPAHRRPAWTATLSPLTWDRTTTSGQAARNP